jgi:hypothetical protein
MASFFIDTLSKCYSLSSASYEVRRAEEFGEERFELLRDQHIQSELLCDECRVLLDELERERWERLEAQARVNQLMRKHLERERLASLGHQRNIQRLERDLQKLQQALKAPKKGYGQSS